MVVVTRTRDSYNARHEQSIEDINLSFEQKSPSL